MNAILDATTVERSSGVFGKSGTGKMFLARFLLAGVIKHRAAVNLIFDIHNECESAPLGH